MSIPVWPPELSKFFRADYSAQNQDPRLRRSASGPPAYRRRFSAVARVMQLAIDVTRGEKAIFDTFYDVTTQHGTLPFYMPDPVTDGWAAVDEEGTPLLDESGDAVLITSQLLCQFGETPPVETVMGARFKITFSVVVMP